MSNTQENGMSNKEKGMSNNRNAEPLTQPPDLMRVFDFILIVASGRGHGRSTRLAGLGGLFGAAVGSFAGPVGAALGGGVGGLFGAVLGDEDEEE